MDGPGRDPRLDREPKVQVEQVSESSDGKSGDGSSTDGSDELVAYLESDEYRNDHLGNYAVIRNPDGTIATKSDDLEGQQAQDDAELAKEQEFLSKFTEGDQARLSPGLNNVDIADLLNQAAEGDPVSQALTGSMLADGNLLEMEHQAQVGLVSPDVLHSLAKDRIDQAGLDAGAAAGGDRDAWVRLNQNLTGTMPTEKELATFDAAGGPSIMTLEKQFEMLGLGTRPQEYLERAEDLKSQLDGARDGDGEAVGRIATSFGIDPAKLTADIGLGGPTLDQIGGILDGILKHPAGPAPVVLGMNPASETSTTPSDATASSGTTSADGKAGDVGLGGASGVRDFGSFDGAGTTGDGLSGGSAPTGGDLGGGGDGGDPTPDNVDPDPGPGVEGSGGGDEQGDASPMQTNDSPPDADSSSQSTSSTNSTEVDFTNEGTTFVAGGGDAEQRADGTARVENPDGSVDQVGPGGENIYHKAGDGGSGAGAGGGGGGAADTDDDEEYVDNDAGGYSNISVSADQAAAFAEQKLVREGGDRVDNSLDEPLVISDIPDSSTQERWDGESIGTGLSSDQIANRLEQITVRGGGDPVNPPGTEEPLVFDGTNPNDPGVYEAGGGAGAATIAPAAAAPAPAAMEAPASAAPQPAAEAPAASLAANLDIPTASVVDDSAFAEPVGALAPAAGGLEAPAAPGGAPGEGEGMGAPGDLDP